MQGVLRDVKGIQVNAFMRLLHIKKGSITTRLVWDTNMAAVFFVQGHEYDGRVTSYENALKKFVAKKNAGFSCNLNTQALQISVSKSNNQEDI